jgi:hypothetical protein
MQIQGPTDRSQSHEDHYFQRVEVERRRNEEAVRERAELAREAALDDDEAIDAMIAAGITRASLPAIEWAPLVFVAWADGAVQPDERDSILRIAEGDGVPPSHPSHALLRSWLDRRPNDGLLSAWQRYLEAVGRSEDEDSRGIRADWLRTRTREVAEASGGWMGFGKVSRDEGAVLLEVARVMHRSGIA